MTTAPSSLQYRINYHIWSDAFDSKDVECSEGSGDPIWWRLPGPEGEQSVFFLQDKIDILAENASSKSATESAGQLPVNATKPQTSSQRKKNETKRCTCDVCGMYFSDETKRAKHSTAHSRNHNGKKPVQCHERGKTSALSRAKTHRPAEAKNPKADGPVRTKAGKTHQCYVCGVRLASNTCLVRHERIHTGEKPFQCTVCGKCFARKSQTAQHARTHSGEKPFQSEQSMCQCHVCGVRMTSKTVLVLHERTHTGEKPFQCTICGRRFAQKVCQTRHARTHSGEKPFSCNVCLKAFSRRSDVKGHMRVHSGEKPFKCEVCGNCFAFRNHLTAHKRVHSGERPYTCSVCGKRFAKSCNCRQHERIHARKPT